MEYFLKVMYLYYCLEQVLSECQNLVKIIVLDMLKLLLSCPWFIPLFVSVVPGQEKSAF